MLYPINSGMCVTTLPNHEENSTSNSQSIQATLSNPLLNGPLSIDTSSFGSGLSIIDIVSAFLNMPRVVADQRAKFDSDEFLGRLRTVTEVRYAGASMSAAMDVRRRQFAEDCNAGLIEIVFVPIGFNLELHVDPTSVQSSSSSSSSATSSTSIQQRLSSMGPSQPGGIERTPTGRVNLWSRFILNGICVVWSGWLDPVTLSGEGALAFDADRAGAEQRRYEQQLSDIQERARRHLQQQQQQPRTSAPLTMPS